MSDNTSKASDPAATPAEDLTSRSPEATQEHTPLSDGELDTVAGGVNTITSISISLPPNPDARSLRLPPPTKRSSP